MQQLTTASAPQQDVHRRSRNIQRISQYGTRRAIGLAILYCLGCADPQACPLHRSCQASNAGPARLRLYLHSKSNPLAVHVPEIR